MEIIYFEGFISGGKVTPNFNRTTENASNHFMYANAAAITMEVTIRFRKQYS